MRKWLIVSGLILMLLTSLSAQNLVVSEVRQITNLDQGTYYFPQLFPNGDKILFTSSNYTGLAYFDIATGEIVELSKESGAGYEPAFSPDGTSIIYRISEYKNRRKFSSLINQDIQTGQKQILVAEKRNLSTPRISASGEIVLLQDNVPDQISLNKSGQSKIPQSVQSDIPNAFIENTNIALIKGGIKQIIQPIGEGHYIWPSVSPDGNKLLFTKMGEATYITDLDGNNPVSLGRANAPRWSPDSKWVVYMDDKDDGYVVLESHLYAVSADGQQRVQLTNAPDRIDMYPVWGSQFENIVFATDRGEIFLISLATE
jgi:Tol biopolymer transport system component